MMRPYLRSIMADSAACVQSMVPATFVANMRAYVSIGVSAKSPRSMMPALLTRTSRRANRSSAPSTTQAIRPATVLESLTGAALKPYVPRFGLNRFDPRSVDAFAADVKRAETLGWDAAFQPDSQLRRRDTYVFLAAAARATERITLGTLLANPVNRHPSVTASSIATIDELAPGRVLLGWGVGDTAVRLAGLRPARVKELEDSTRLMRGRMDS